MIEGPDTILRAIEPSDLEQLRRWRNDPVLRRNFREYREISSADQQKWYDTVGIENSVTRMFSITDRAGALLGACGLCSIDWIRRSADFSIYLGGVYLDEKYAPCAAKSLIAYGFDELGLHRLWAEVYEFDEAKAQFLITLGFQQDGVHRDAHFADGRWWSSSLLSFLQHDRPRT